VIGLLAYIPFLYPMQLFHDWWYLLLLPLSVGISIAYKAMRLETLDDFWRHVAVMTVQIILGMIGLAVALTILVQLVIPQLPLR